MNESTADRPIHDPRMRGFRARVAVEEMTAIIDSCVAPLGTEEVPLTEAGGRVLGSGVVAEWDLPPFDRAAMDGYALHGEETFGAGGYSPARFRVIGRSRPARAFVGSVGPGQAVEIATGAPIPVGADAVAPVETTRLIGSEGCPIIEVVEAIPPGRHVGRCGEDVKAGDVLFGAGRRLRPQDLGVLSAQGIANPIVRRRPIVAIVATGDEILPMGNRPRADSAEIADMNTPMLVALVRRDGGTPRPIGPLPDLRDRLRATIAEAASSHDVVLIVGGSSTGPEDHAPGIVAELGELLAHGVAIRPASPAGFGRIGGKPVVLLPGNPVSCLCGYDFFAARAVRRLAGLPPAWPYPSVTKPLAVKLTSALGRVDYARVRIGPDGVEPLAIGGASILSGTTRADGFVVVPTDSEGYGTGADVTVWLYDSSSRAG